MKLNQEAWIKAEGKRRGIQQRYLQDHDEGAACEALRKVSAKAPDLPAVLNDLVFFALRVCEGEVARQAPRRLLRVAPENAAAVDRAAEALNAPGYRDEALAAWQRLLRTPHWVQAITALAMASERAHRLPEARDWISQA